MVWNIPILGWFGAAALAVAPAGILPAAIPSDGGKEWQRGQRCWAGAKTLLWYQHPPSYPCKAEPGGLRALPRSDPTLDLTQPPGQGQCLCSLLCLPLLLICTKQAWLLSLSVGKEA